MKHRIVITGVGLTSPLGNNLNEFRQAVLNDQSGIRHIELRYIGKVAAGLCEFDEGKYQKKKMRKRGTRAGAISTYCAAEALNDAKINLEQINTERIGIYVGTTEHGNVETEQEVHDLIHTHNKNVAFWSHHHNPRSVSNTPAGEVTLNLKLTGPAYTIGSACAGGNMGIIQGAQMLQLDEIDLALAGGVSESPATFGIFAAFTAQGALGHHDDPTKAGRPFHRERNGVVVSEGGALFALERLEDALKRNAKIYAEIIGYHCNSDATDFVLPNPERQIQCMQAAIKKAGLTPQEIDLVNMHATGTPSGDIAECEAVSAVFGTSNNTYINATKGHIGHAMGAAGALELAVNLPSLEDGILHGCKTVDDMDEKCNLKNLINGKPLNRPIKTILSNSFGMLGINSTVIVKKYQE